MKIKKLLSSVLSTNAAFVILLLLQIAFLMLAVASLGTRFYFVYFILIILDIILAIYITNKNDHKAY